NSDARAQGGSAGFSFIGDAGFIGFSVSDLENNYGLPPGTHGHAHGDEEEEHGEDEHEEEGHEEDEHEEEVEFVRIDLDKTRYDARGMLRFSDSWIDNIRASIGYTDYQHKEIETFADGEAEVGTLYSNEGLEGRMTLERVATGAWSGVYGLQWNDTDFSAIGEEAFIPASAIGSLGFFGVERFTGGNASVELGFRVENSEVDASAGCGYDDTSISLSGSVLYDLNEASNLLFGLSRSERAPTVEELLSNVDAGTCRQKADDEDLILHAATGLLEIGNPNLDQETANNIELGFRQHAGPVTGELSAYYNEIDDYIFLDFSGEEFEEQPLARYLSRDAVFSGLEGRVTMNLLETAAGTLEFGLFGDLVRAEFDSGGNVPRIPPAKLGAELRYFGPAWTVHLHATRAFAQDDEGELELPTDAYTSVSLYADYHWLLAGDSELTVFLKGDNLLDEEIRNHASFLKNYAPEPGRGFRVGLRFEY
ncbi:MAG: TonB-dependent receptor, partial [Pseudohongiellaceae bacterium]